MLTQKEKISFENLGQNYQILRITDDYFEFTSRSTKHYWIIKKELACSGRKLPYTIYHKHKLSDYYHRHWQSFSFEQCINSIIKHDNYVLRKEILTKMNNMK